MPSSRFTVTIPMPRLIVLLAALALCGCGRLGDRADLVCLNGPESELLDPALITAQATSRIAYAVFEGLTAFDAKGLAAPGVAERWEISPDGLHYTFHLRHNALWSNGDPVTAEDFLYAWRRALIPETASEYAYQLYYIHGAKDCNEGKSKDFSTVGVAPRPIRSLWKSPWLIPHALFPRSLRLYHAAPGASGDGGEAALRLGHQAGPFHRQRPISPPRMAALRSSPPSQESALLGCRARRHEQRGHVALLPAQHRL